ncbi:MAG TPA: amino acid transporter, partial [Terrimesophilobacter sp.]|nr:amino acid transporter [Terrimesophilobacter sp.]
ALLGAVFLRGFKEAIGIAVVLVGVYLLLNLVVVAVATAHVAAHATLVTDWWTALTAQHGNPAIMVGIALLVFPKLALGLSGFETGVAVMPQITGGAADTELNPVGRIGGARRLLTTAALIMSGFLITSSIVTTLLIPQEEFQPGGAANGRALAYLAHEYLGAAFGTLYDLSTICILWFAGASAMAGLLNLVPRYLPRYGMAPQWARAVRPLVVTFTAIAFLVTIVFRADVDAQGGAYATGVLVLMTSATVAATLSARRKRHRVPTVGFAVIALIFLYTTVANVIERPDGVRIATLFILGILTTSIISRIRRSFQVRATSVTLDEDALGYISEDSEVHGVVCIVSHEPGLDSAAEYQEKSRDERRYSHIPRRSPIIFLEVYPSDSSEFEEDLVVHGVAKHGYRVLQVVSNNVPNTIAAALLEIRDQTGTVPEVYFEWTEGSPISNMLRFLVTGTGEVAPVTREVLRETERDAKRRPTVHVS